VRRHELPEQQAFTSRQAGRQQPGAKQATPIAQVRPPASDVITFTDSAGHVIEADEGNYDDAWPGRLPSSSRRYQYPSSPQGHTRVDFHPDRQVRIPSRRSATPPPPQQTEDIPAARSRRRPPPRHRSLPRWEAARWHRARLRMRAGTRLRQPSWVAPVARPPPRI